MNNKLHIYIICSLQFVLFSCKNDVTAEENEADSISTIDYDLEKKILLDNKKDKKGAFLPDSISSETYLNNIKILEQELDSLLQLKKGTEANLLYEDYSQKLIENLTSYNFSNSNILDNYINYEPTEIPEEWKLKITELKALGIELIYEGEGYYSFQFKHDYFYNLFKNNVTTDLQTFLQNYAEDDKTVFQMDAGIVVPWKEIRKRIIRWENFIINNPESRYVTTAKEVYGFYLNCYLLGMENTRTYEESTKEIYPEIKADFNEYIQQNPNTFGTEVTKDFLEYFNYAAANYDEDAFNENIKNHVNGILQETLN